MTVVAINIGEYLMKVEWLTQMSAMKELKKVSESPSLLYSGAEKYELRVYVP